MDGSVTIRIFQVINTFNIFRNDFLNIVQCPAGANRHAQAKLVRRLIIRAGGQRKVVRVVNQVQREGIDRGCIACQLLADLQLTGCVCDISSTGRGSTQRGMKILKCLLMIVTAPVVLVLTLFVWLCTGLIYISGLVLGLLSTVIALLGVAVLITYSPQNGVILLVMAFLISPMGLPLAAIWLLGKVQSLKFAIQDWVYG